MKILVTGGLGFIGSHTVVELIENNHKVVILDNLSNSKLSVLDAIEKITGVRPDFYQTDLLDPENLEKVFLEHKFDGVIHFAGLKAVAESIAKPLEYYENNITGTINLLKCMKKHNLYNIVFSSSACVYGLPESNPIDEDFPSGKATNPYGMTKCFIEQILNDCYNSDNNFKITILRYFNPVGAHSSGLIGEDPNGIPNNLMPVMLKVAEGKNPELKVFGNDYNTYDGTCVRDFIHVVDLARGHVNAMEKIKENGVHIFNLGTGKGTSVLELINTFNQVNGDLINYTFANRRPGDVPENYANPTKAQRELDWKAHKTLEDMCKDSWNFIKNKSNRNYMKKLIFASNNQHKLHEVKRIFDMYDILSLRDIGFTDEIVEDGLSFQENAFIKAEAIAKFIKGTKFESYAIISDDSGLCVKAINYEPGIMSARYSGGDDKANRSLLLSKLMGISDRTAYFQCYAVLMMPDGQSIVADGKTYGLITKLEIGNTDFGYDCIFWSDTLRKTFGQATPAEKDSVSHRAKAMKKIKEYLDTTNYRGITEEEYY